MVLEETLRYLHERHPDLLAAERVERVAVGVFFTAVQLSGGHCGLSRTESEAEGCCAAGPRDLGEFRPGTLSGRPAAEILAHPPHRSLFQSVRMATLNAVSAAVLAGSPYRIEAGRDPVEWVDTAAGRNVTLVGAFQSYLDRLAETPCTLRVLELEEEAVPPRHRGRYVPAEKAAEVLPRSDAVLVTGSTLSNGTVDGVLSLIPPGAYSAVVGPTSGLVPEALFRLGVRVVGSTRVLDPGRMFDIVGEGGAGYHLFRDGCAEKICILRDGVPA